MERVPLHPTIELTEEESYYLILQFCISHHLTNAALVDLLQLINCHLPESKLPSKYSFLKYFPDITTFKSFFFCPDCFVVIDFEN